MNSSSRALLYPSIAISHRSVFVPHHISATVPIAKCALIIVGSRTTALCKCVRAKSESPFSIAIVPAVNSASAVPTCEFADTAIRQTGRAKERDRRILFFILLPWPQCRLKNDMWVIEEVPPLTEPDLCDVPSRKLMRRVMGFQGLVWKQTTVRSATAVKPKRRLRRKRSAAEKRRRSSSEANYDYDPGY